MANDITGNPWILDTAEEVLAAGKKVTIIKMIFYAQTAGNDLAMSDGHSHPFWKVRAAAAAAGLYHDYAGTPFELIKPIQLDGFVIDTIDDGAGSGSELWVWVG